MNKRIIVLAAIVAIALLELVALLKGINGAYLALSFTAIGSAAGFVVGKKF